MKVCFGFVVDVLSKFLRAGTCVNTGMWMAKGSAALVKHLGVEQCDEPEKGHQHMT
jgi:hypothetical protein